MNSLGRRIEIGALLALCFFLPLYEAPKSIAWVIYVLAWLINRTRARDFGGRWDLWDTLIAVWIASGFLVTAFAGLHQNEWRGVFDLVRYGSILWIAKRTRYTAVEVRWVLGALVGSTVIGLFLAFEAWSKVDSFQLNSVGHVNHTAIYLAIMLGVCAAWLFAARRLLLAVVTAFILVSLFLTASRGAVGVGLVMLLALAVAWWPRSRLPLGVAAVAVVVTVATAWLGGMAVIRKQQAGVETANVLAYRDTIWRVAIGAWQRYPVFGIGMDNFKLVMREEVKAVRRKIGPYKEAVLYVEHPHAHSLFFNTLAERGLVGTAALAAVLLAWLVSIVRHRPPRGGSDEDWILWSGAASAWIVTVGVGIVNTTLHDEHGLLAMLLLGLWLSRVQSTQVVKR